MDEIIEAEELLWKNRLRGNTVTKELRWRLVGRADSLYKGKAAVLLEKR